MSSTLTRWHVVNSLSCARFAMRNFGVRAVTGTVPIAMARVDVDRADRPVAVLAELDLGGIDTGNARRDRDLRKPALLDLDRHPTLVFTGGSGERDGDGWRLPGRICVRGTGIDVVLAVTVNGARDEVRARAHTSFDRRSFGLRAPRLLIGHRIDVTLDLVLSSS